MRVRATLYAYVRLRCVYVRTCVCVRVHVCVCVCVYVYVPVCVRASVRKDVSANVCIRLYTQNMHANRGLCCVHFPCN